MKLLLAGILTLLLITTISASAAEPDLIIVNSQDWKDVYSTMLFSSMNQKSSIFLASDRHSSIILNPIPSQNHLWLVNSRKTPFVTGFGSVAESRGNTFEEFNYDNANLEFARQTDTKKFILVDDSYGYNAISVAPYAVASGSYVLFADRDNIAEVSDVLSEKGAESVIIYGHVDREVKNAVSGYNPEIINEEGDRFANNVEIVKKFQSVSNSKQAIFTNGEFIESSIMSGKEPVVFIGTNNVPDVTRDYIKNSDIKVGVLVGNELVNTATFIRRQIGISVFVKFARSARAATSSISQVEALDIFRLPRYNLNLTMESVTYNQATKQIEIAFSNNEEQAVYAKGSYAVTDADGSRQTIGDTEPIFVEGNEVKTFVYNIEQINAEGASIDVFVVYGESRNSLEKTIEGVFCAGCENPLRAIDVIDNCDVAIPSISYAVRKNLFRVDMQNNAQTDCYVDVQLNDVMIAAERTTLALQDTELLSPGEAKSLRIKAELDEEDISDNPFVNVKAFYGQRKNSLVNEKLERLPLLIDTTVFGGMGIVALTLMAATILAVALFAWKIYASKKSFR